MSCTLIGKGREIDFGLPLHPALRRRRPCHKQKTLIDQWALNYLQIAYSVGDLENLTSWWESAMCTVVSSFTFWALLGRADRCTYGIVCKYIPFQRCKIGFSPLSLSAQMSWHYSKYSTWATPATLGFISLGKSLVHIMIKTNERSMPSYHAFSWIQSSPCMCFVISILIRIVSRSFLPA